MSRQRSALGANLFDFQDFVVYGFSIMKFKLPPAPWTADDLGDDDWCVIDGTGRYVRGLERLPEPIAKHIALCRNAMDVQHRRGWAAVAGDSEGKWVARKEAGDGHRVIDILGEKSDFDDPFTAIVEADKWYKENVEP